MFFSTFRKAISPKAMVLMQSTGLAVLTVICLLLAIDLSQYVGSVSPLVPGTDIDIFAIGSGCLFVVSSVRLCFHASARPFARCFVNLVLCPATPRPQCSRDQHSLRWKALTLI